MSTKQWLGIVVAAALLASAATYLLLRDHDLVLRFSEQEIQQKLGSQMPRTRTFYYVINVTLDAPRVSLIEGTDRIRAGLDVSVELALGRNRRPLRGSIDVTSGIRYAPGKGQFFLTEPTVDQLIIEGIPATQLRKVQSAITDALTGYYAMQPIHTLKDDDTRQSMARRVLKSVVVESGELVVTLGM